LRQLLKGFTEQTGQGPIGTFASGGELEYERKECDSLFQHH